MKDSFGSVRRTVEGHVQTTMHPAGFHGDDKTKNFFEGWYVKLISADRSRRLALIPGIFLGPDGEADAFVQVLDGATGRSWYHQFPREEFAANALEFDVHVGSNRFSSAGVHLDLPGLTGDVRYASTLTPWPVTATSPGIMGWYGWVPTMECYHGLVSFDHDLEGSLILDGERFDFTGGRGYIEKDWGQAFPSAYVWMQSNHFSTPGTSLSASMAIIPWRRSAFRGFIVGLWHRGELVKFANYTGAKARHFEIDDDEVRWSMTSRSGMHLGLTADRVSGGLLHAPVRTQMHRRVEETLDSTIRVRLTGRDGRVIFDDVGTCAGLEVHGDLTALADF
ncbi:MAG: tocopherol cyclase family protein [Candidatus Nanopelagicales bacterium]